MAEESGSGGGDDEVERGDGAEVVKNGDAEAWREWKIAGRGADEGGDGGSSKDEEEKGRERALRSVEACEGYSSGRL